MQKLFLTMICFFISIGGLKAEEKELLAHSTKEGITVYADKDKQNNWCKDIIYLRIYGASKEQLKSSSFQNINRKLGIILNNKCSKALFAHVYGYDAFNHELFYKAIATGVDLWKINWQAADFYEFEEGEKIESKGDFSVFSINPLKIKKDKTISIIKEKFGGAKEFIIETEDKKCAIKYLSKEDEQKVKKYYITVKGNPCKERFLSGKGGVRIFDGKGGIKGEGTGYFAKGYFTYNDNISDVFFLTRYAKEENIHYLAYYLGSDDEDKIHYIGYLKSEYNEEYGNYSYWNACNPFIIGILTQDTGLFLNQDKLAAKVLKAASYSSKYCKKVKDIKVLGIKDINIDPENYNSDKIIFKTDITSPIANEPLNYKGDMSINKIKDESLKKEVTEKNIEFFMEKDYRNLLVSDYKERLFYYHGVSSLSNPYLTSAYSIINNKDVFGNYLLRVKDIEDEIIKTDWPMEIYIKGDMAKKDINKDGWYIISGNLKASLKGYSDKSEKELLAEKITACTNIECAEVIDSLYLVRNKYKHADFIPSLKGLNLR